MFAYLCITADGAVINVTRSIDGAAHFAAAHSETPFISGDALTIEGLTEALRGDGTAMIIYAGTETLTVQRHALLI